MIAIVWLLFGRRCFLRVLVTGGAGFIGSHVVRGLVSRGLHVVVLDDFSSGKIENLEKLASSEDLRIVRGNIRDRKVVEEVLGSVDSVVHLAAFVNASESVKKPLETHDINVNGTLNILDGCIKKRVKKLVFASSAAVYGDGNPLPLREKDELRPISPYAASKVCGEYYCKMYCNCYGFSSTILRFFNVYGPGQGSNEYAGVITRFVNSGIHGRPFTVYGDGNQTRDFVNVKDVVTAVEKAISFKSSKTDVFNICTGEAMTINDLVSSLCRIFGKNLEPLHARPRAGDILCNYGDPVRAQKVLGFKAKIRFEDGLRSLIKSLD
jgi:UDP-glucose 4-epimerase